MKNEITRKVLVDAVKLIKQWHDFPLPAENAPEEMFRIYYEIAPEMKSIREALGPYDEINNEPQQPDLPAENTVMWWLCRIADDEVRRKAVGNVTNDSKLIEQEPDFENAVYSAFEWSSKEEGHDYWKAVAISEIPLLSEPEFREYLELKGK